MKQYLIFPSNDFYSYLSVTIEPENLNQHLIEIEILNEGENYKDFDWRIFENGTMIQQFLSIKNLCNIYVYLFGFLK